MITSTAMPSESGCVWTHHILCTIVYGNQGGYTRHSFTLQWEIPMYDVIVAILGIAYPVMIIGFIVGAIIITFGGWNR